MDKLRINADRLWRSLMELAQIGATPKGGVKRLTLTEEDRGARDLFARWAREAGLAVEVDAIGNVFARRAGTDSTSPPVAMAATSTLSLPAANSTARTASWPAWRCCAP